MDVLAMGLPAFLVVLLLGSCQSTPAPPPAGSAWVAGFEPPSLLMTDRVLLEPLAPGHVELDFAALMGSREHLRATLAWGDWPRADFTLDENRADLVRHWGEFERREAYAYTVLAPDRTRCLGCIYLNPASEAEPRKARLDFWVIEEGLASDLDLHLVRSVLDWIEERFPIDSVSFHPRAGDARGVQILQNAGLEERDSESETHRTFAWSRAPR